MFPWKASRSWPAPWKSPWPGCSPTSHPPACRRPRAPRTRTWWTFFLWRTIPTILKLRLDALKGISNRVQVARDGREALDYLFREGTYAGRTNIQRPQLILLDLGLPKIDGFEVLRRVKADPHTASIPVVVLTASDRDRDLQMSRRLGAQACIVKPVGMPNLTQVTSQLSLRWALLKPVATVSA